MGFILEVVADKGTFEPECVDRVTWESHKQGVPGQLDAFILEDGALKLEEGQTVRLRENGSTVFCGRIFALSRDGAGVTALRAYDNLRYLKNKDSFVFEGLTASGIIRRIAGDFGLALSSVEETGMRIESLVMDNKTLFDVIGQALELTNTARGSDYVLYDDTRGLALRDGSGWFVPVIIDAYTAEAYEYETSIDKGFVNRVKLKHENMRKGVREVFVAKNKELIDKYGLLQYYAHTGEPSGAMEQARQMLRVNQNVYKCLTVGGAFGDSRVSAGCRIEAKLSLPDRKTEFTGIMVVDRVRHSLTDKGHFMDLWLSG